MGGNSCKRLSRASFRSSENFRWLQLLRSEILSWLNCNKAVLKQSWRMVSARRCSGNTSKAKGNNHVVKNTVGYYIPQYHWKIGLEIRQICLENIWSMAAAVQARPKPQTLTALERRLRKSWRSIFDHYAKSYRLDAWQTEGSHQKQRRHCSVLTFAHCLEVTLVVVALMCNFWVLQHYWVL